MPDLKSALISIQQQIRISIDIQTKIDREIQKLIDEVDESSPDRSPASIEAQVQSLMASFGPSLYQQLKEELSKEIGSIRSQMDEIKQDRSSREPAPVPIPSGYSPTNQQVVLATESTNPRQNVSSSLRKLIADYNQLGVSFGNLYQVTEVDETKDAIEAKRANSHSPVVLFPFSQGKFWLLESEGYSYLFPNLKQSFNKHNVGLLSSLFLFGDVDYSAGFKRIVLRSPAIVCADRSGGVIAWQLEEKGDIISFN